PMEAKVSADLLTTIFTPYSPLHDGAVLVRGDRIIGAGCVLPLTQFKVADKSLGTRHRAALGLSEETDATVLVVSEETSTIAVAKGFGLEAVEAALAAGLADVGENRVQEALEKLDTPVGRRAKWHLVGHLQRNKAKHVAGRFALIHSVDSAELAEELDKRAGGGAAHGAKQRVLLQVNVAGETQKSGCAPADAPALAHRGAAQPHLALEGLMTIAPFTDDQDVQRRT